MLPVLGQSKLKAFLMLYLLLQGTEHCHSGSHPVRFLGPSALAPGASRKRQSLEITVPTGLVIAHRNSRYLLDQSLPLWGGDHNRQDFYEPVKISKAFKTKLLYRISIQYQADEHLQYRSRIR